MASGVGAAQGAPAVAPTQPSPSPAQARQLRRLWPSDIGQDWETHRALWKPGPGTYEVPIPPSRGSSGGRFNQSNPKSDVDWKVYLAKDLPGPGHYGAPSLPLPKGGRIGKSSPLTSLEVSCKRAEGIPGPGTYGPLPSDIDKKKGGRFNMSRAKNEIEWIIYSKKDVPAPGSYYDAKTHAAKISGGRFNQSKAKSELDWVVYRAQGLPGPGTYTPRQAKAGGGRFNLSNPKSDLDWNVYRSSQIPGPGSYNPSIESFGSPKRGFSIRSRHSGPSLSARENRHRVSYSPRKPSSPRMSTGRLASRGGDGTDVDETKKYSKRALIEGHPGVGDILVPWRTIERILAAKAGADSESTPASAE